jgi:hypothetical protein
MKISPSARRDSNRFYSDPRGVRVRVKAAPGYAPPLRLAAKQRLLETLRSGQLAPVKLPLYASFGSPKSVLFVGAVMVASVLLAVATAVTLGLAPLVIGGCMLGGVVGLTLVGGTVSFGTLEAMTHRCARLAKEQRVAAAGDLHGRPLKEACGLTTAQTVAVMRSLKKHGVIVARRGADSYAVQNTGRLNFALHAATSLSPQQRQAVRTALMFQHKSAPLYRMREELQRQREALDSLGILSSEQAQKLHSLNRAVDSCERSLNEMSGDEANTAVPSVGNG